MDNNVEQIRKRQEDLANQSPIFAKSLRETLEQYLLKNDIDTAKKMFCCNKNRALEAISQYDPKLHDINNRKDKPRQDQEDYKTCKLTDASQRRINQIASHFMFANPLKFTLGNSPEETVTLTKHFQLFKDFLKKHYFDEKLYESREITGSETECAKLYSIITNDDGESEIVCQIKCNSKGDTLYSMKNQYGKLVAFAIGYYLRNEQFQNEEHFDVYTSKDTWCFNKPTEPTNGKWILIKREPNPIGKIPIIYYNHETDWDGADSKIEHLEWSLSKNADTIEYFGDPYLLISPDIADERLAGAKEVGKVMVVGEDGRFEFVAPPECGDMIQNQKDNLNEGIERDTHTPDWTYKNIMGLGTPSSKALRQSNIAGYVKRDRLANKYYNELIRREINLIIAMLCKYEYVDNSEIAKGFQMLDINFSYTDPFVGSLDDNSQEIAQLRGANAMSIHTAVETNYYVKDKEAEEKRIWEEIERKAMIEAKAAVVAQPKEENINNKTE